MVWDVKSAKLTVEDPSCLLLFLNMTNPTNDKSTTKPSKARLSSGLKPLSASGASSTLGDSEVSLEDRIRISFEQLGYPQLSAIQCTAEGDQLRLTGVLNSFYLKQVAQSVAVKIPGVRLVHNEIEVR